MAPNKHWTEEMDRTAIRMYEEKSTLLQVGYAVGVSRKAAGERLKKLGVDIRPGAITKFSRGYPYKIGPEKTELPDDDSPVKKTLIDLEPHECHWPLGRGPAEFFCGALQANGTAYCLRHAMVAYRPVPQDRPNASRPHFIKILAKRLNTQHIHGSDFE